MLIDTRLRHLPIIAYFFHAAAYYDDYTFRLMILLVIDVTYATSHMPAPFIMRCLYATCCRCWRRYYAALRRFAAMLPAVAIFLIIILILIQLAIRRTLLRHFRRYMIAISAFIYAIF